MEFLTFSPFWGPVRDLISLMYRRINRNNPIDLVAKRLKLKKEIEDKLQWQNHTQGYGEAIIRDIHRTKQYPDIDTKHKGISPWFRVGIIGTYHQGVEVGLRIDSAKYVENEGGWRLTKDYNNKTLNCHITGRIPFDRIIAIDWTGDEYYPIPHIYCTFDGIMRWKQPYEAVHICEKLQGPDRPYYSFLTTYDKASSLLRKYEN